MGIGGGILKNFISDKNVGAAFRSSRFLVRAVARMIPPGAALVIEYGPGNGAMTRALLNRLAPDGVLIAVEQNEAFRQSLASIGDPRLTIVPGLAQEFDGLAYLGGRKADAIVASIPFSFLTSEDRDSIAARSKEYLRPGGSFIVFHQYKRLMRDVVARHFSEVRMRYFLWNMPPCYIISARKES